MSLLWCFSSGERGGLRVGDRENGLGFDFGFFRDYSDRGQVCEGLSTTTLLRFIKLRIVVDFTARKEDRHHGLRPDRHPEKSRIGSGLATVRRRVHPGSGDAE
jgi:hypothetical protein